jgi:microcompartment protein CcmK/EutM
MRIARVIGKLTLNRRVAELRPGNYLLVRTCSRRTLAGADAGNEEVLVTYDCLAAREGNLVGIVEGREATAPFHPDKVPYDCYCAAILDELQFRPVLPVGGKGRPT